MGLFSRMIEWMGDHKLLTGLGAASVGYLVFSSKAAKASPALPGAKGGAQQLPGGGIATATHAIPPPTAASTGQAYYVTTDDPPPNGNLNARQTAEVNAQGMPIGMKIGYWPKNGPVELLDAGPGNGMVYVRGPGIDSNGTAVNLAGWAYKNYLVQKNQIDAAQALSDQYNAALDALGAVTSGKWRADGSYDWGGIGSPLDHRD